MLSTLRDSLGLSDPVRRDLILPWLIALAGLLVMYVPSIWDLLNTIWLSPEQGHGPIVFGIALWLLYRKWPEVLDETASRPAPLVGWLVLTFGVMLYVVGRSQDVILFEIGSLIWVLIGLVLILRGARVLGNLWFPLFFMCFMVPLPGPIVDAVTLPLKLSVSYVAESVLYWFGYPIARSGVTLQIGQYQLLVADACAGLHTLFTLEALGLLYLNLIRHASVMRNVVLATLIVPISFSANVIRVMVLTLITYYFGDEAGQGFLHGFAGMVLFVSALLLIMSGDALVRFLVAPRKVAIPEGAL